MTEAEIKEIIDLEIVVDANGEDEVLWVGFILCLKP